MIFRNPSSKTRLIRYFRNAKATLVTVSAICRSIALRNDTQFSDSDSDNSSSSTDSNVYYSVYDQKNRKSKTKSNRDNLVKNEKGSSTNNICFQLQIGKGQLTMYTPVRVSL
jgi:hypothetical protein